MEEFNTQGGDDSKMFGTVEAKELSFEEKFALVQALRKTVDKFTKLTGNDVDDEFISRSKFINQPEKLAEYDAIMDERNKVIKDLEDSVSNKLIFADEVYAKDAMLGLFYRYFFGLPRMSSSQN